MRSVAIAIATLVLAGSPGRCDAQARERDFDHAREAVTRGDAMSLADILAKVGRSLPGEIVAVELEHEGGRWVYEFKVIDRDGRRREFYVDARSGDIVKGTGR